MFNILASKPSFSFFTHFLVIQNKVESPVKVDDAYYPASEEHFLGSLQDLGESFGLNIIQGIYTSEKNEKNRFIDSLHELGFDSEHYDFVIDFEVEECFVDVDDVDDIGKLSAKVQFDVVMSLSNSAIQKGHCVDKDTQWSYLPAKEKLMLVDLRAKNAQHLLPKTTNTVMMVGDGIARYISNK